jgi:hypothetical protein
VGIVARVRGRTLEIATEQLRRGYGPCRMSFVLYARFDRVILNGRDREARRLIVALLRREAEDLDRALERSRPSRGRWMEGGAIQQVGYSSA